MEKGMRWYELLKRHLNVLTVYCVKVGLKSYIRKETDLDFEYRNHTYIFGSWYLDKDEDDALLGIFEKKDPSFFKELLKQGYCSCYNLVQFSEKIKKGNFANSTLEELKRTYLNFVKRYISAMGASLHLQLMAWEVLLHRLEKELEGKIDPAKDFDKFKRYILVLTSPQKESPVIKEQKDLLKIAIKKPSSASLSKHVEKYGWMNVHDFLGEVHSTDYYLNRIKEIKNPKTRLVEIEEKKKKNEKEREKISSQLQLPREVIELIELMQEYAYFRNYRRDLYCMAEAKVRRLFEKMGEKVGISYEEVLCLTPQELVYFLEKKKDYIPLIKERKIEFAVDKDLHIYSGEELQKIKQEYSFLKEAITREFEIKGDPVFPGKVRGTVKVILSPKELGKIKQGDILVTNMTTPEYVIAMEKAAAIVTDRGGILCHAAIVAREMNKPCIVGTRHATKVLKDGDFIEVDAQKGTVRKISR